MWLVGRGLGGASGCGWWVEVWVGLVGVVGGWRAGWPMGVVGAVWVGPVGVVRDNWLLVRYTRSQWVGLVGGQGHVGG